MFTSGRQTYVVFFSLLFLANCSQKSTKSDYWIAFNDTVTNEYGYKDVDGKIVVPSGKYPYCFTDTFRSFAIVQTKSGFIAIDRKERVLYNVFAFDNGPDYSSEGVFRITKDNKIGYANATTGKIVIEPQFQCAFPFENGVAKVSNNCQMQIEGEHTGWVSNNWFYVDSNGHETRVPANTE